ncbi:molecular chaperone DnaK [Psychromonas marina]|nr:molecular chaperone DnaK [Psychromonas marina]
MYHLNEKQLAQLKLQLNSKLIKVRATINTIFLESDHSSHHLAAKNLARLSADELIEFTSQVENSSLKRNVEKLKKLDASLNNIEHSMYGLCSDCESEMCVEMLTENPTKQRCMICEDKYQKQKNNRYRL